NIIIINRTVSTPDEYSSLKRERISFFIVTVPPVVALRDVVREWAVIIPVPPIPLMFSRCFYRVPFGNASVVFRLLDFDPSSPRYRNLCWTRRESSSIAATLNGRESSPGALDQPVIA